MIKSPTDETLRELIVCSLEPWDEIWRRNQFFVDHLLRRNPALNVLFVEPPTDPIHAVRTRRRPDLPRFRWLKGGRLLAVRPLKVAPRRLGPLADWLLLIQVRAAIQKARFTEPLLWLNDSTYGPLIAQTGYPTVYDMTDDWLAAASSARELTRLRALEQTIFEQADEVVVCSKNLLATRKGLRALTLIENGVDAEHFMRPRSRPADLPPPPVAVYVGSLHASRLDVDLLVDLASTLPNVSVALVGPDSLEHAERSRLSLQSNVVLLGSRPYDDVPAYLQHADVIVVPHLVNAFTDSLDPIKAYECLVVEPPTVATPIAGFRELSERLLVVPRERFVQTVERALSRTTPKRHGSLDDPPSWAERASAFEELLTAIADRRLGKTC